MDGWMDDGGMETWMYGLIGEWTLEKYACNVSMIEHEEKLIT